MSKNVVRRLTFLLMGCMQGMFTTEAQVLDRALPEVVIEDMEHDSFNTASIDNEGKPIIVSFWATWCGPCVRELTALSEVYDEWRDETGVKLYAVSIDDTRNVHKVAPFVNGKGWEFEVLLDVNGDFKRAMNVNNIPHTFLMDRNRRAVWQRNAYVPGDEEVLFEKVKTLAKEESSTKTRESR